METGKNTVQKMVSSLGNPYEVRVLADDEAAEMGFPVVGETSMYGSGIDIQFIIDPENSRSIVGRAALPSNDKDEQVNIKVKDVLAMSWVIPGVYNIYLKIHDGPTYRYVIGVKGMGPQNGTRTFSFTDEEPDTYKLALTSTELKWHALYFNSKRPSIRSITWDKE